MQAGPEIFLKGGGLSPAPRFYSLAGGCMRPMMKDGDIVPVFPCDPYSLRPGDLIVYRNHEKKHLHRIWWKSGDSLWVKDDAASVSLQKISRDRVVGRCREWGVLGRGWSGLAYSLLCSAVFYLGRSVKRVFVKTRRAK